jgi:hypothetical protein
MVAKLRCTLYSYAHYTHMHTILNKMWYYSKIFTLKSKKFIVVDHVEMDKRILLKNTLAYHVKYGKLV